MQGNPDGVEEPQITYVLSRSEHSGDNINKGKTGNVTELFTAPTPTLQWCLESET